MLINTNGASGNDLYKTGSVKTEKAEVQELIGDKVAVGKPVDSEFISKDNMAKLMNLVNLGVSRIDEVFSFDEAEKDKSKGKIGEVVLDDADQSCAAKENPVTGDVYGRSVKYTVDKERRTLTRDSIIYERDDESISITHNEDIKEISTDGKKVSHIIKESATFFIENPEESIYYSHESNYHPPPGKKMKREFDDYAQNVFLGGGKLDENGFLFRPEKI